MPEPSAERLATYLPGLPAAGINEVLVDVRCAKNPDLVQQSKAYILQRAGDPYRWPAQSKGQLSMP